MIGDEINDKRLAYATELKFLLIKSNSTGDLDMPYLNNLDEAADEILRNQ